MPTKRNRRVGVQSRKVKKPKNVSRKLSVSGKAKKRGSSTRGSGTRGSKTRRLVQRGGDPTGLTELYVMLASLGAMGLGRGLWCTFRNCDNGKGRYGNDEVGADVNLY